MKRELTIQRFSICAALIFIVLTSGCVGPTVRSYEGDKLPKSEVAVIKGWYFFVFPFLTSNRLEILQVDGDGKIPLKTTSVEVRPGWHELVIREYCGNPYSDKPFTFYHRLAFNAESGHEYNIKLPVLATKGSFLTIVDTHSGTVVARKPMR